ncbi:Epimerase family protein [Bhargavaea cecembensis DSE10]|uniref:Epimerase family protein n=1 Tax=Bhargavaea cecembensis DSE10 TaxID=1235279 RepID=M7NUY9_9BACL|nr:TIGR01777 family oxidoreductase [Bhargavaea cecembensis]EMR05480.1 Epimerase family protein [Bhargavaea cecembensis DSE10]
MRVAIAGGTGFLGSVLAGLLEDNGHEVLILTRRPAAGNSRLIGYLTDGARPEQELGPVDALVNLAGTSINSGRWTERRKQDILTSRIAATDEVVRIIRSMKNKPGVLVNASAIGLYPTSETAIYNEEGPAGNDFLADVVKTWEHRAAEARKDGVRTVFMRFGVILGKDEGALPLIALPYRLFAGGTVGSGRQWVSWIHVLDAARAILFAIENEAVSGAVNAVAPNPLRMKDFGRSVGRVLGRPHFLPVPAFALKAALGEKSKLVLEGQRVAPSKLGRHGFRFRFPDADEALRDILISE